MPNSALAELLPPGLRSPLRLTLAVLALLSGLLLTGCAERPPKVIVERVPVPAALLTCRDEPQPPALITDRNVALWILDVADAGQDCRDKLGRVREVVQ